MSDRERRSETIEVLKWMLYCRTEKEDPLTHPITWHLNTITCNPTCSHAIPHDTQPIHVTHVSPTQLLNIHIIIKGILIYTLIDREFLSLGSRIFALFLGSHLLQIILPYTFLVIHVTFKKENQQQTLLRSASIFPATVFDDLCV